jgi:hypothetical protein
MAPDDARTARQQAHELLEAAGDAATIALLDKQLDADLATGKGSKKVTMFTPSQRRGESLTVSYYVIGRA